jgi:hypothetical protein
MKFFPTVFSLGRVLRIPDPTEELRVNPKVVFGNGNAVIAEVGANREVQDPRGTAVCAACPSEDRAPSLQR